MNRQELHLSIEENTTFTFARSSGNGGQNVNKVNTKVHGMLPVAHIRGLTQEELAAALRRLHGKVNANGVLCIDVDDERRQEVNRAIALARLERWLCAAAHLCARRRKTRPTRAAKERRLRGKKLRAAVKAQRTMPSVP